jgi:hypothetical protein
MWYPPENPLRYQTASTRFLALFAASSLFTGCIVFPTPGRIERESVGPSADIRKMTGLADSERPIRPGVTRPTVHALLGEPDVVSQDGREERSTYRSYKWWVFCIVPLGHFWGDTSPTEYVYLLTITFDDNDHVESISLNQRPG